MKVNVDHTRPERKQFTGGLKVYIELETDEEAEIFYQLMNQNIINESVKRACTENLVNMNDVNSLKWKIHDALVDAGQGPLGKRDC